MFDISIYNYFLYDIKVHIKMVYNHLKKCYYLRDRYSIFE